MQATQSLDEALKQHFGYDSFLPLQEGSRVTRWPGATCSRCCRRVAGSPYAISLRHCCARA